MDFDDTAEEGIYRAEVRCWLEANAPAVASARSADLDEAARLVRARAWQALKAEAGYARVTWPREWGGGGGTPIQQVIFNQEEARFDVPSGFFGIGLGMCLPTVMKYAEEGTRQRFVAPALRGEQIWCQLFSEPSAGSDAAAVRTRAVRSGDDWIVSGQKVWTTGAHYCDYGLLLTRTDPSVPKHRGLTMFWIDMKAPGVSVRPIHQMTGGSDFNEVYLDQVRIADAQRLGEVGEGWKVAIFTLMNERVEGGKPRGPEIDAVLRLAAQVPHGESTLLGDGAFRARLADWFVQSEGLKYTRFRTMTALSRGLAPGPEASIGKLVAVNRLQDLAHELIEQQDLFGLVCDPARAALDASLQHDFLYAPGLRIAGGTDEILKNIIAERVLGLPPDVRVDKDVSFNALPGSH
ncbi:MAG: acyl-CoA dehydrogenase family protein [Pseudomonas sp.]|uniref:acyl-CoA dehydrogenase family protein n=1 Tax=Pseudomonas sp. TaxID=306 RepID=UPI003981EEE9